MSRQHGRHGAASGGAERACRPPAPADDLDPAPGRGQPKPDDDQRPAQHLDRRERLPEETGEGDAEEELQVAEERDLTGGKAAQPVAPERVGHRRATGAEVDQDEHGAQTERRHAADRQLPDRERGQGEQAVPHAAGDDGEEAAAGAGPATEDRVGREAAGPGHEQPVAEERGVGGPLATGNDRQGHPGQGGEQPVEVPGGRALAEERDGQERGEDRRGAGLDQGGVGGRGGAEPEVAEQDEPGKPRQPQEGRGPPTSRPRPGPPDERRQDDGGHGQPDEGEGDRRRLGQRRLGRDGGGAPDQGRRHDGEDRQMRAGGPRQPPASSRDRRGHRVFLRLMTWVATDPAFVGLHSALGATPGLRASTTQHPRIRRSRRRRARTRPAPPVRVGRARMGSPRSSCGVHARGVGPREGGAAWARAEPPRSARRCAPTGWRRPSPRRSWPSGPG